MVQILNPDIYQKAKAIADKKYSKPSAYKSGFIVKTYKEMGGRYADDGNPKNLKRWFKEDWKDVAGMDYPVYRPTKKVSKNTPLIPSEIEPTSLVEQSILKQKIKGKSNLPPFKAKGGKRTAKEIKDFLEASYQENPPNELDGFILDKSLSTDTAKVYYNPQTKEAVVAHRGTKGALDWGNNLAYALGYYDYTPRYKKGKSVQDKAEEKYGKSNISTLGHSQGSILARKLGADTKEVINVNPAYAFEKPKKNEYNIRSKTDVVSGLYAPISYARSVLFPKYSKKHDITIPSKSTTDVLGEHSYNILDRLGNQEIGVGAGNKISTNTIMKGGRIGLDQKIKQLVYIGIPQQAVALLLHSGNLETIWKVYSSGNDIKPYLAQVLNSLEPRKARGSLFDLNVKDGGTLGDDEDPLQEAETSEPLDVVDAGFRDAVENAGTYEEDVEMEGGMRYYPVAYANVGTNPKGVRGGKKLNIGKAFKKMGSDVSKAFKPVGKALETGAQGLAKGTEYVNPMMWALKDKDTSNLMAKSGEITHDYLLPAVVSAGKPIYDATAMTASTMLTGNPVLGKAVADTLWNEMVAKKGYDPRENQKSKELGELSETFGKAVSKPYSASLGGMGRKKTKKSQEQMWNEMSRLFAHFKKQHPKSRIRSEMGFAKKMVKEKPNKKLVEFSKAFIKEFK